MNGEKIIGIANSKSVELVSQNSDFQNEDIISTEKNTHNPSNEKNFPENKKHNIFQLVTKLNDFDDELKDSVDDYFDEQIDESKKVNEFENVKDFGKVNESNSYRIKNSQSIQWSVEDGMYLSDEELLTEIYTKVNKSRVLVKNYCNLFGFLIFTALYISVLYLQANTMKTFEVASSHKILLPQDLSPDSPFSFSGIDDVYSWINESLIQPIWKDPSCGDGICQHPLEYKSFGFYGCYQDCGKFEQVTEITIQISSDFPTDKARQSSSWNLCMSSPLSLCWYPNSQTFPEMVSDITIKLEVPDGNWTVRVNAPSGGVMGSVQISSSLSLNQTNSTSISLLSWGRCSGKISETALGKCREICSDAGMCLSKICENFEIKEITGFFVDCAEYCDNFPDNNPLKEMSCSSIFESIQVNNISNILYNIDCKLNYSALTFNSINKLTSTKSVYHSLTEEISFLENFENQYAYGHINKINNDIVNNAYVENNVDNNIGNNHNDNDNDNDKENEKEKFENIYQIHSKYFQRSLLFSSSNSSTQQYSNLWKLLGRNDNQRFQNLKHVINRALYTWVKDDCLASSSLQTDMSPQMHKFFCLFLGGPPTLCNYTISSSKKVAWSDLQLYNHMNSVHSKMKISMDQQNVFSQILLNALDSVVELDTSDVRKFSNRLRSLDDAIVTNPGLGCNKGSFNVEWSMKAQHSNTINVGSSIKWIWADDEPHSIRLSSIGDDSNDPFEGMGAGRMLVSRKVQCTPLNVGYDADMDAPLPCNLQFKHAPQSVFTYTKYFDKAGNYSYKCGRHGSSMSGQVFVVDPQINTKETLPPNPRSISTSIYFSCAPGCIIGLVKNGLCNPACNVRDCAYDGGDCGCASDDFGLPKCACPSGQMRSDFGSCCQTSSIGVGLLFPFALSEYSGNPLPIQQDGTLERYIAQHNRVLIGLILMQKRKQTKPCSNEKYVSLSKVCSNGESNAAFGVNPLFLPTSSLFDPEKANKSLNSNSNLNSIYNLSFSGTVGNVPPAFLPLWVGSNYGFPFVLDINLKNMEANDRLQYLIDGFFMDNLTKVVDVQLITYNVLANTFVNTEINLDFQNGGKINVNYNIDAISPDIYKSGQDWIRLALEIGLVFCISYNLASESFEFYSSWKKTSFIFSHFQNFWNYIDFISLSLMVLGVIFWIHFVISQALSFSISPRYSLLVDIGTLPDDKELSKAIQRFVEMKKMINFRSFYFAIHGINIFLMVLRVLKFFHFQPKIGILTLTLAEAFPELLHFFILFSIVFIGYAVYGHLLFGSEVYLFRSLTSSFSTCFNMLLGDTSPSSIFFRFHGWKFGASIVFFWTFYIVVFFILMNLLIAIVVDAFIDVKNKSQASSSVPYELFLIFKKFAFRLFSPYRSYKKFLRDLNQIGANKPSRLRKFKKSLSVRKRFLKVLSNSSQGRQQERLERCRKKIIKLNGKNYDLENLEIMLMRNKFKKNNDETLPEDDSEMRHLAQVIMQEIGENPFSDQKWKSKKERSDFEIILEKIKQIEESMESFRYQFHAVK